MEKKTRNQELQEYTKAYEKNWLPITDMYLINKDLQVSKTINKHPHVLEAHTTFFEISKYNKTENVLLKITDTFLKEAIDYPEGKWHFRVDHTISYQHENKIRLHKYLYLNNRFFIKALKILNQKKPKIIPKSILN